METVAVLQSSHLLENGNQAKLFDIINGCRFAMLLILELGKPDSGTELDQRFGRPQSHNAVGIAQPAQQHRERAGIGKRAQTHESPQPYEPYGVLRQFVEDIEGQRRLDM